MDALVDFLESLRDGLSNVVDAFLGIANYILFIAAILMAITMLIVERRGDNIAFNFGKWILIALIGSVAVTLAKEIYGIA